MSKELESDGFMRHRGNEIRKMERLACEERYKRYLALRDQRGTRRAAARRCGSVTKRKECV
jgi:hypothetical protein